MIGNLSQPQASRPSIIFSGIVSFGCNWFLGESTFLARKQFSHEEQIIVYRLKAKFIIYFIIYYKIKHEV